MFVNVLTKVLYNLWICRAADTLSGLVSVLNDAYRRKTEKHATDVAKAGGHFVPLVVSTTGVWHPDSHAASRALQIRLCSSRLTRTRELEGTASEAGKRTCERQRTCSQNSTPSNAVERRRRGARTRSRYGRGPSSLSVWSWLTRTIKFPVLHWIWRLSRTWPIITSLVLLYRSVHVHIVHRSFITNDF